MPGATTPSLAIDSRGLAQLARSARENSPEATRLAAQQFEAMFTNMMLKSMRDATPATGPMDNDQTRMYQQMLDQQLAQNLAQRPGSALTQMLERQFNRQAGLNPAAASGAPGAAGAAAAQGAAAAAGASGAALPAATLPATLPAARAPRFAPAPANAAASARQQAATIARPPRQDSPPTDAAGRAGGAPRHVREFIERVMPHAEEASRATGIPAHFLVAQAALETGWGRSEVRGADGRSSFNLFNVKTGSRWGGNSVQTATIEYRNGAAVRENARFRSYDSYAEAFRDYADLLRNNPRYAAVLNTRDPAQFARGLAAAGYATDPEYAAKLERVIGGRSLARGLMNT